MQKVLAEAGLASRRASEELIGPGGSRSTGRRRTWGPRWTPRRRSWRLTAVLLSPRQKEYWLLNKPAGVLSAVTDARGRPTVTDCVPTAPGCSRWAGWTSTARTPSPHQRRRTGRPACSILAFTWRRSIWCGYAAYRQGAARCASPRCRAGGRHDRAGDGSADGGQPASAVAVPRRRTDRDPRRPEASGAADDGSGGSPRGHAAPHAFAGSPTPGLQPGQARRLSASEVERLAQGRPGS